MTNTPAESRNQDLDLRTLDFDLLKRAFFVPATPVQTQPNSSPALPTDADQSNPNSGPR